MAKTNNNSTTGVVTSTTASTSSYMQLVKNGNAGIFPQVNTIFSSKTSSSKTRTHELSKNSLIAKCRIRLNYNYYKRIINMSNQLLNYCGSTNSDYMRSVQIDDNEFNTELRYLSDSIDHYKLFKFSTEGLMGKPTKGFHNNAEFKVLKLESLYGNCKHSLMTANNDIDNLSNNLPITSTFKKIKLTNVEKIQIIKSCIDRMTSLQRVLDKTIIKNGDKDV